MYLFQKFFKFFFQIFLDFIIIFIIFALSIIVNHIIKEQLMKNKKLLSIGRRYFNNPFVSCPIGYAFTPNRKHTDALCGEYIYFQCDIGDKPYSHLYTKDDKIVRLKPVNYTGITVNTAKKWLKNHNLKYYKVSEREDGVFILTDKDTAQTITEIAKAYIFGSNPYYVLVCLEAV